MYTIMSYLHVSSGLEKTVQLSAKENWGAILPGLARTRTHFALTLTLNRTVTLTLILTLAPNTHPYPPPTLT
jgi:hypothetical protein